MSTQTDNKRPEVKRTIVHIDMTELVRHVDRQAKVEQRTRAQMVRLLIQRGLTVQNGARSSIG